MTKEISRKITLTELLLVFQKTYLNLLRYEKKPQDNSNQIRQVDTNRKSGDPESR